MRSTAAVSVLGLLAVVGTAHGQSRNWAAPVSGNWGVAANWSPADVPDTAGETALISPAGSYTVTLGIPGTTTVGGLGVASGATLDLNVGSNLLIAGGAGAVMNNGLIRVNPTASSFDSVFGFGASGSIQGSGVLELSGGFNDSQLNGGAGVVIGNGAGHTIRGSGQINADMMNAGTIRAIVVPTASELEIRGMIANEGLMTSVSGSVLGVYATEIDQAGGGDLDAGDGTLRFVAGQNSAVRGGRVLASGGGTIRREAGETVFDDVELLGDMLIDPSAAVRIEGAALTNEATLFVNDTASSFNGVLVFDNSAELRGSGTVFLGGGFEDSQVSTAAGATVRQVASHTIAGSGTINASLVNDGVVRAEVTSFDNTLLLRGENKVNRADFLASTNAVLDIGAITIDQSAGGVIDARDGTVRFTGGFNSTIVGGEVVASLGGVVVRQAGTTVLDGVTLDSRVVVDQSGVLRVTGAGLTNHGMIELNLSSGSFDAVLVADAPAVLDGTGTVLLGGGLNDSRIDSEPGASFTQLAGHTVEGAGQINASFVNNGLVRASTTPFANELELQANDKVNNAVIEASAGAVLAIGAVEISQSPSGTVRAGGGDVRFISGLNSSIVGGSLEGPARRQAGVTELSGVTLTGTLAIDQTGTVRVTSAGLTNNGTIEVNLSSGSFDGVLVASEPAVIDGTGTVVLGGGQNDSRIDSDPGASFTQLAGHTVEGGGQITASFVNNGLVRASATPFANVLELVGNAKVNNAVMEASAGALLAIGEVSITQGSGGLLSASGGEVRFLSGTNASIVGGALVGPALRQAGVTTLDGVTLSDALAIDATAEVRIAGDGLTNNGIIRVNDSFSTFDGVLRFASDATLGGFGTVLLGGGLNDSQLAAAAGTTGTVGSGQQVVGEGTFLGSLVVEGPVSIGLGSGDTGEIFLASNEPGEGLTLAATSSVEVDLISPSNHDRFTRNDNSYAVTLGGTLDVFVNAGYSPRLGDEFDIVELGGAVSGSFATVNVAGLAAGYEFVEVVRSDEFVLRVINSTCAADIAEPYGSLTFADISSFLAAFNAGEPPADLAAPVGVYTFADISAFLGSFAAGCP